EKTEALLAEKKIILYPAHLSAPEAEAEASIFKTLLVATCLDQAETPGYLELFDELMGERCPACAVSVVSGQGLAELGRLTFEALGIIRVYTKQPGKTADKGQPYTLPQGSTVLDLAATIHKEIADKFRHARLWGSSAFEGQMVPGDYVLAEGDIVEVHA
ncbi:MAG: TGS domain-containing protein, partial [Deltaproteobacteria bacterium]|nr:TGS domain-containing protein [Deltaproteobacteria bacterium]